MTGVPLKTRNATLSDLAALLQDQQSRKVDVVAPASTFRTEEAVLVLNDGSRYVPTKVFDEGVAEKLGIPSPYLRRMREDAPELYDANVNGWLEKDSRKFLLRTFRGNGAPGVARAMLSDQFKIVDNFDVLTAALDGVRNAGVNIQIEGCDLTERRMYVRITCPEVAVLAPKLLERYRAPNGNRGIDDPLVWSGFVISNSETGGGAFMLVPRLVIKVCMNGATVSKDALRAVHLGGKLDEGVIEWSEKTRLKNLELVTTQTVDAVSTFLNPDYVQKKVAELEQNSDKEIEQPQQRLEFIGKQLRLPQERINAVLDHFIRGGDPTAGGVFQAMTSVAQTLDDPDEAFQMEDQALPALVLAAS